MGDQYGYYTTYDATSTVNWSTNTTSSYDGHYWATVRYRQPESKPRVITEIPKRINLCFIGKQRKDGEVHEQFEDNTIG